MWLKKIIKLSEKCQKYDIFDEKKTQFLIITYTMLKKVIKAGKELV